MASDGWTIVSGRKSARRRYLRNVKAVKVEVSRDEVVSMMDRSLVKVKESAFYSKFLSQIQDSATFAFLEVESLEVVMYGIGSIAQSEASRCQLALMLLLRQDLTSVSRIYVYDPVLSASEYEVLLELGCTMIDVDEQGLRKVNGPTLFYMPHCQVHLYNNVLRANWDYLKSVGILGNSFKGYAERWSVPPRPEPQDPLHLLTIQPHAEEHAVDAMGFPANSAFNSMSWHFFRDGLPPQVKSQFPLAPRRYVRRRLQ